MKSSWKSWQSASCGGNSTMQVHLWHNIGLTSSFAPFGAGALVNCAVQWLDLPIPLGRRSLFSCNQTKVHVLIWQDRKYSFREDQICQVYNKPAVISILPSRSNMCGARLCSLFSQAGGSSSSLACQKSGDIVFVFAFCLRLLFNVSTRLTGILKIRCQVLIIVKLVSSLHDARCKIVSF